MSNEHPRRRLHRVRELLPQTEELRKRFQQGDMLAPFECCALWESEGLDPETLPRWVIDHLAKFAAAYYRAGPDFSEISPREYRELTAKERKKREPDLNKIAGLSGTRGSRGAWLWRAEHGRDPYMEAYAAHLVERARAGEIDAITASDGRSIRVLDAWGRVREEFLDEIGRLFRVGGFDAPGGRAWHKGKTVKRRLAAVRLTDK